MLASVVKYAYPNAKTRAMKGLLLSEDQFRSLLNTDTFDEVLHVLQTTQYAKALAELPGGDPSTLEFTQILYNSLFRDYEKIIRSVDRKIRDFFILLYQKYELINLKTILRAIVSGIGPDQTSLLLLPTDRYTLFSKKALLDLYTVPDVITHLQGTFFHYPLNRALRRFEEEQEFFPLEMALDLHYYHTLWDTMEKLPDADRKILRHILGMSTDILNVSWIIRFKEEFRFSPEEILNYTILHGEVFKFRERKALSEVQDTAEIIAYLKKTPYGTAFSEDVPLNTVHIALSRYMIEQVRKYFSGNPFHIGVLLGYLWLKEFEISDILTIAEAKKYGFSLEQSRHYVIHVNSA